VEPAEVDRDELLRDITCPEQRARTAREWAVLDDDANSHLYGSGNGRHAQINAAIIEGPPAQLGPKARKKRYIPAKKQKRAKKSAKRLQVLAGICPTCGRM